MTSDRVSDVLAHKSRVICPGYVLLSRPWQLTVTECCLPAKPWHATAATVPFSDCSLIGVFSMPPLKMSYRRSAFCSAFHLDIRTNTSPSR